MIPAGTAHLIRRESVPRCFMMLRPSFPSLFCGMRVWPLTRHASGAAIRLREAPRRPGLQPGTFSSPACTRTSSVHLTSGTVSCPATTSGCEAERLGLQRGRVRRPDMAQRTPQLRIRDAVEAPASAASRPRTARIVADLLAPLDPTNLGDLSAPDGEGRLIERDPRLDTGYVAFFFNGCFHAGNATEPR